MSGWLALIVCFAATISAGLMGYGAGWRQGSTAALRSLASPSWHARRWPEAAGTADVLCEECKATLRALGGMD